MQLKIGAKVYLIVAAAFVGLILAATLSVRELGHSISDNANERTQRTVETAHGVLKYYQSEEAAGRMSRAEAQQAAISAVRAMRYDGSEYFWINDMHPNMIMHPMKPELDGTDISGNADPNGVKLFTEMVNVVKQNGEGFVSYSWPKPDKVEPQPKVSYVKGFEPWGWVIGTGVYVDDVDAAIFAAAVREGSIVLVIVLVVLAVGFFLARSITSPLNAITDRMRGLADGDKATDVPGLGRRDEIGNMANALEVFREAAIAKDRADDEKRKADEEQQFVVEALSQRLERLSDGDLTAEIEIPFPAKYETLKSYYNGAVTRLGDLISALSSSAAVIRTGSKEIAQAAEDLARRTESNAASLEQTSASLTEMRGRFATSTEASERTVGQTGEATRMVDRGRQTADMAVTAMTRVAESAQGIDGVIEGLDKIAFQTRVLAMNAAVEAGRAGEAGQGFAVVADLVSALAMRAEEEAGHAREQLTTTQADIGAAVNAVQDVDGALVNISSSVNEVNELVTSMAETTRAQLSTIGEITSAVGAMDTSTQQNAAMVEETSAAARNLQTEVDDLAERSAAFRTNSSSGAPAERPANDEGNDAFMTALANHSAAWVMN